MAKGSKRVSIPREVPRITLDFLRDIFTRGLSTGNPYFIREAGGRDSIRGCQLRVLRTKVWFCTRSDAGTAYYPVVEARPDMTIEEVEQARWAVRAKIREVEDEQVEPTLAEGRRKTIQQLWDDYRADYVRRRHHKRSPRTLEQYDDLWNCHLLPLFGELTLQQFVSLPPSRLQDLPEEIAARVQQKRPWAEGRHTGNLCLAVFRMAWEFARRRGWILKDPFLDIEKLDAPSAKVYLEDLDLAAVGEALRNLEAITDPDPSTARKAPSLTALLALRVVLYTGCRHVEELLKGKLSWLRQDYGLARLEVPRSKGDRGARQGRVIYLGPDALHCLLEIPRPPGCDDLVPGRVPGTQMSRLTDTWERVLLEARKLLEQWKAERGSRNRLVSSILHARIIGYDGEKRMTRFEGEIRVPVKAIRHTVKTIHPRARIVSDHSRQLLGHQATSLGDRVYLHEHGPSLSEAASKAEVFIRRLMGDLDHSVLTFHRDRTLLTLRGGHA